MNFNHENQKTLELRTEDAKDCDEWVAAIAHARYQGLPHAIRVSLLLHPTPAMRVGQRAAGLPLGIAKMVGNGIVGVGIGMLGRIGAASAGGRTDGKEGMATWGACRWLRCVQLSVSCLWVLLRCVSGGCGVPGAPGATLRAVSAHSYRTLATEHEALMQKYLHLLQIVETEKTVAKQLRQQIEDGEIEIERLKAEVRGGPGAAAGTAGTVLRADGGLCHTWLLGWGQRWVEKWILGRDGGSLPLHSARWDLPCAPQQGTACGLRQGCAGYTLLRAQHCQPLVDRVHQLIWNLE